jgi:hypothetical protein
MSTALKQPETKEEIRKTLVWMYGSIAQAAVKFPVSFPVFRNVLYGITAPDAHPELVRAINKKTGASDEAWGK